MSYPTPDQWMDLVAEYPASGLSHKEFVAKHDVHLCTLQYWLYRKSKTRSKKLSLGSNTSPKFLPLKLVASPAPLARRVGDDTWVEAALRSGVLVRFAVGTDTRYLAELFAALG